jgi:beta-glucuronidase
VPTVATDWWNHGGITRDVHLITLPAQFIEDFQVQLAPNGQDAHAWVQLNPALPGESVTLSIPEAGAFDDRHDGRCGSRSL